MAERKCRYMVNTDVSITLYLADSMGLHHPLLAWFRRHEGEVCYSELLRDELSDMEARGRLCPGDAQRALNTLRRYGAWEEPARVGQLRRRATAMLVRAGLSLRLRNDAALALHAAERGLRLATYNTGDYERLAELIPKLIHIRPPGEPLAYTCSQGGQASKGVQGRGREGARQAPTPRKKAGAARRGDNRRDSGGPVQAKLQGGRGKAAGAGKEVRGRKKRKVRQGGSPRRGPRGSRGMTRAR